MREVDIGVAVVKSRVCRNAAKITNVVMTALERDEICLEKDSVESKMKPRFLADKLGVMGEVEGREGLTLLEVC